MQSRAKPARNTIKMQSRAKPQRRREMQLMQSRRDAKLQSIFECPQIVLCEFDFENIGDAKNVKGSNRAVRR